MSVFRISTPIAPLLSAPSCDATCVSEALYGERVTLLEELSQWARVRQHHDEYEGFIHVNNLELIQDALDDSKKATHWVTSRSSLLFKEPDLKSQVVHRIPFASELHLTPIDDSAFSRTNSGFYVWTSHCLPMGNSYPTEPLPLAHSHFIGMPYRWGGRSPEGADCSGLIQLLARSQGISIPRDSGDQEKAILNVVAKDDAQQMDIVYWPGHTGILTNPETLLHSTAHTLSCVVEPLEAVVLRAGNPSSIRRLFT